MLGLLVLVSFVLLEEALEVFEFEAVVGDEQVGASVLAVLFCVVPVGAVRQRKVFVADFGRVFFLVALPAVVVIAHALATFFSLKEKGVE